MSTRTIVLIAVAGLAWWWFTSSRDKGTGGPILGGGPDLSSVRAAQTGTVPAL